MAIGQGEILATPLQIANLSATIANRGWYYTPHVVRRISGTKLPAQYTTRHTPHINKNYYQDIAEGMGFAPMNNPKIAICVYVENAGFGATFGVPIGGLMMEKYLTGQISPHRQYIEDRMLESNTIIYSGVKKH